MLIMNAEIEQFRLETCVTEMCPCSNIYVQPHHILETVETWYT